MAADKSRVERARQLRSRLESLRQQLAANKERIRTLIEAEGKGEWSQVSLCAAEARRETARLRAEFAQLRRELEDLRAEREGRNRAST
jgi:hypothetical protein